MTEENVTFEFPERICDSFGEQYPVTLIETDIGVMLHFHFRGQRAGHLYLTCSFPVLRIEDPLIRDDLVNMAASQEGIWLSLKG